MLFPWLYLACFLGLSVAAVEDSNNDDFSSFLDDYWRWRMEQSPEFATKVGSNIFADRWQSLTEETFQNDTVFAGKLLSRSKQINIDDLDDTDAVTMKVVQTSLRAFISGYKYRKYTVYNPVTPLDHPSRDWKIIISKMPKETVTDYENLIKRYIGIEKQVNEMIALMMKAIEMNTTQHEAAMSGATEYLDSLLTDIKTNSSFFHEPMKTLPNGLTAEQRTNISQRMDTAINMKIKPAVENLKTFLNETYKPKTRPLPGVSSLPNGSALYAECLRWHLDLEMTAQEVHNIGLSEVTRIAAEIELLMQKANFQGNLTEYFNYLKSKPENYYKTEEAMLNGYRQIQKVVHQKLGEVLPEITENCPVKIEQNMNPLDWARYSSVTDDNPGVFFINVFKPETRPTFGMVSLVLHETEPGHHTQACYVLASGGEKKGRQVSFLKYYAAPYNFPFFTSFVEGWALYAESLGEEMGVYNTSNKMLGRYLNEIFRAARLVIDTGIHAFGWTKQQAVDYLSKYSTLSTGDIGNQINRYISWPGQACAYKIGELHIKKLRAKAEKRLGKHFDKRYFNEAILKLGSVPLSLIDDQLDKWAEKVEKASTSCCGHIVLWLPVAALSLFIYSSC